jgi:tetratricopeptide (TPR) repeat protein
MSTPAAPPPTRPARAARLRPLAAAAAVLVIAGCGYAFLLPEVTAGWHWRRAAEAADRADWAAARRHLDACRAAWPESGEVRFAAARAARRAGDPDAAAADLRDARRLGWPAEAVQLEELLVQAQAGVPRAERPLRDRLAAGHPEEPVIFEALARGALQCRSARSAHRWASLWAERHPDDWYARYWLGAALEAGAEPELAAEQYARAAAGNPGHADTRRRLGEVYRRLGRYPEAVAELEAAAAARPDDPAAIVGLAHAQREVGRPADAARTLDRLPAGDPPAAALQLRGLLALDADRPADAVGWLERADARDPHDRATLLALAAALRQSGRAADADRADARAREREADGKALDEAAREAVARPDDPAPRHRAGTLCLKLGRPDDALRWLVGGLALDPAHGPTRAALADCLRRSADPALLAAYRHLLPDPGPNR